MGAASEKTRTDNRHNNARTMPPHARLGGPHDAACAAPRIRLEQAGDAGTALGDDTAAKI